MAAVVFSSAPAAFSRPDASLTQLRAYPSSSSQCSFFPSSTQPAAEESDLTPPYSPSTDYSEPALHSSSSPFPPSNPYLSFTPPFSSFPHLPHHSCSELRISDNSRSHANPAQKKKGGCKAVQLLVRVRGVGEWVVGGKCDVRKSFSNGSFAKYYDRGQWGVVGVDEGGEVVLVVEEAKKGRDGKWFVGMERSCTPPYSADDGNPRHPLLAFSADSVYRLTVLTGEGVREEDVEVEVKCLFELGSATVSRKRGATASGGQVKRKREEGEEEDGARAGRRVREGGQTVVIERPLSVSSSLSSLDSTSTSPSPTLTPSSPSSPTSSSSSSSSCSSPFLSSFLSIHHVHDSDELFLLDEATPPPQPQPPTPSQLLSLSSSSPFRSPMGVRGWEGRWVSPLFGLMEGGMVEVPDFELK